MALLDLSYFAFEKANVLTDAILISKLYYKAYIDKRLMEIVKAVLGIFISSTIL